MEMTLYSLRPGPNELLRVICILAAAPARLLRPFPEVLRARRRAYEMDYFTVRARLTAVKRRFA